MGWLALVAETVPAGAERAFAWDEVPSRIAPASEAAMTTTVPRR
jgi:hypothetical protein